MRISSAIRWVTMIMAVPLSRISRIFWNKRSVESKSNAADDSSNISRSGSHKKPRAMVIQALMLSGKVPAGCRGSTSSPASSLIKARALCCFSLSDILLVKKPSAPINKLSTTDDSSATNTS